MKKLYLWLFPSRKNNPRIEDLIEIIEIKSKTIKTQQETIKMHKENIERLISLCESSSEKLQQSYEEILGLRKQIINQLVSNLASTEKSIKLIEQSKEQII